MTKPQDRSQLRGRRITAIFAVAVVYALVARVSFVFEIPPHDIRTLVPAAGIGLAAVVLGGWPMALAILLGSFIHNLHLIAGMDARVAATSAAIASSAALQAILGDWVLRRFVGHIPPARAKGISAAIGLLALTSTTTPIIRTVSMCVAGYLPWSAGWDLLWTAWIGTYVGVLFVGPLLIVIFRSRSKSSVAEPVAWPIASGLVALALLSFNLGWQQADQRLIQYLSEDANEMRAVTVAKLLRIERVGLATRALLDASTEVTREEFASFASTLTAHTTTDELVIWAPRVPSDHRPAFEEQVAAEVGHPVEIFEIGADATRVRAAERPEYFPATYFEPFADREAALGFDMFSEANRRDVFERARDSGQMAMSRPVQLVTRDAEPFVMIASAVYRKSMRVDAPEARRDALSGIVTVAFRAPDMFETALEEINPHDIEIYLFDVTEPEPLLIAFHPSKTGPRAHPDGTGLDMATLKKTVHHASRFEFAGRTWEMVARPGPGFVRTARGLGAWTRLSIGLLAALMFVLYVGLKQKTLDALRSSEARYRLVSENAGDSVWTFDPLERKVTYISPSVERLRGFTADEVLEQSMEEIFTPASLKKAEIVLSEQLADAPDTSRCEDFEQYHKDGSVILTEITMSLALDEEGRQQIVGVSRDVSARRRAEESLRKSRENLEMAQAVAHLGSWDLDPETGTGHWSNEMFRLFDRDPASGPPTLEEFLDKVHPEDFVPLLDAHQRALGTDESVTTEYRVLTAGKDVRHYRATILASRDENGHVHLSGTVLDITKRKRAELERQALLEILQGMAATSNTRDFLATVRSAISQVIYAENLFVVFHERERNLLDVAYFVDQRETIAPPPDALLTGRAAWVFRNDRSVVFTPESFAALEATGDVASVGTAPRSWMGAPLRGNTGSLGVIAVQDYETADRYTEQDRLFFESVGTQVALALERQRAQEELVVKAERLAEAERISHMGVWELDLVRDHLTWSDEIYRIFEVAPTKFAATYDAFLDAIHPEDREMVSKAYAQSLETREPYQIEHRLLMKDGRIKYVRERCESWFDETGKPIRSVGTVQDVTEAHETTELILQLSSAVEQTGDAVVITDIEGHIEYVNPAFERQYGYSLDEVYGLTPRILKSGLEDPSLYEEMWSTILRGEIFETEIRNRRRDGTLVYEVKSITPIRGDDGSIKRFVATGKDITERKEMEHALKERLKELTCQRTVQMLLEENPTFEDACRRVAAALVPAMQFPEITRAIVEIEHERATAGVTDGGAGAELTAEVVAGGRVCGRLWIEYVEDRPFLLPEEQNMLDGIAYSLAMWMERRLSESALRASEQRFRYIFDSVGVGLWEEDFSEVWRAIDDLRTSGVTDFRQHFLEHPDLVQELASRVRILRVNPAGMKMHRIDDESRIDEAFAGMMTEVQLDTLREELVALADGQRYFEAETINSTIDGRAIDVWLTLTVPVDRTQPVLVSTMDITSRKHAEDALREATALYQTVFDVSLDGLAVFDENFRVAVMNRRGAEMYGFASPDDAFGTHVSELAAPGNRDRVVRETTDQLRSGIARGEMVALRRDGSTFDAEFALIRLSSGDDRNEGLVVGVTRDITTQKRENALRAAQFGVTRLLVEAKSLDSVAAPLLRELCERLQWETADLCESDPATLTLRWSDGCHPPDRNLEAFAGYTLKDPFSLGAQLAEQVRATKQTTWIEDVLPLGHPRSAVAARFGIRAVVGVPIRTGDEVTGMIMLSQRQPRTLEPDMVQMLENIGGYVGLFAAQKEAEAALQQERNSLARRVTERTAELSRVNADLSRAVRAKDEFLANMSHELRTPLNAILALSETLLEQIRGPLNERQQASVRTIEASGRHLLTLITDILDLSKVEAGRMELQLEPVSISDVCEASLTFVRELASKKQIKLALALDDPLARVEADPKRFKQMLVNLLSNAVKFTSSGGSVTLEARTDAENGVVRFQVRDTGAGISPEDLSRLFQPFTQVDSSLTRQHEGTGLGLALVRRLAELHGGMVSVESEPGKGSCFTIVLPWKMDVVAAKPEPRVEPAAGKVLSTVQSALVVEDSEATAEQLARYLEEIGVLATIHPRGSGAFEQALALRPDVILLDLLMPDTTGWEVLERLKADPRTRDIPVIIASVVDERSRGLDAGAAEYIVKPVSRESLRQKLLSVARNEPPREALIIAPVDAPVPTAGPVSSPTILLAEDTEANVMAIGDYLVDVGFELVVARDGREAIERAAEVRPDLILMDVQMPGMDGLEATRRLRADASFSTTPIIALTGLAMPGDRERCLEAGMNEYLTKPVRMKALVALIRTLLGTTTTSDDTASASTGGNQT